ncbi:MAG: protein phosphatase 2C domain-containing protein, partial [Planctomycetota bacterium]
HGSSSVDDRRVALEDSLTTANERIFQRSQDEVEHRGMGTTMTAAFVLGDEVSIAQVGDSRAYLLRKGKLVQVTKDQSLISQLIEDGTLTEEEAERLGGRNIILQALGVESRVEVQSRILDVLDGDVLVLCSDGLTGMVKDEDIQEVIEGSTDAEVACARLVTLANDHGGRDNITVILCRFEGSGLRPPLSPLEVEESGDKKAIPGFAAPAAPTAKRSRTKPAIGFGVFLLLAVLAYLIVFGGRVDVTFEFPGPGAEAILLPNEGGDAITVRMVQGEARGIAEDLEPGSYRLVATLAHYEPLEKLIEISRETSSLEVGLRALPGLLRVVPSTPKVTAEIEKVNRKEWEPAFKQVVAFNWMETREIEEVEAGDLLIRVTREGFRPAETRVLLPPEGEATSNLPEMDPILGVIRLSCPAVGAVVKLTDDNGEVLLKREVPESGKVEGRVRVGGHTLEITHPLHEAHGGEVRIAEKSPCDLGEIALVEKRGNILVKGPPEGLISLRPSGQDVPVDQAEIPPAGEYLLRSHPPGQYIVELTTLDGASHHEDVQVLPGKTVTVEFPK